MSGETESLWYRFQGGSARTGLNVIAATSDTGNVCIMCVPCGYVFVDGDPFTDESHEMDSGLLAKALYYHRCDIGPKPEIIARSRGKLPI